MAGLFGSFLGGSGDILIKVGADVGDAVKGLGDVKKSLGDTAGSGARFQKGVQAAAIPAAAALTGLAAAGIACAKAAATAEESQAKLDEQIKRSTGTNAAGIQMANDWVAAYSKQVAISQGELRPALAGLVRATGDLQHAQELLTVSADVAAASGKDLGSVSAAVGKAYNGQAGALKRLVPSISDAAVKSGDWATIQKELNKQTGGAAVDAAKTTEGQYRALQIQMQGLQVTIGKALLPVFQQLIQVMIPLAGIAKEHTNVILALGAGMAALAIAVLAANAVIKINQAVTIAAAAAERILGTSTLGTTLQVIRQRVTMIVLAAAQKVVRAATLAWTAAQWLLNVALDANPIGLVVVAVVALGAALVIAYRHSSTFRNVVQEAFQAVIKYGWLLLGPIGAYIKAIQLAWEHSATFRNIATGAFDAVYSAISRVIDLIGSLAGKLGGLHKPSWLPLSVLPTSYYVPTPAGVGAGTFAAETGSGMTVNVTVTGAIDPESTALQIRRILERHDRRRGRRPLGGEAPEA